MGKKIYGYEKIHVRYDGTVKFYLLKYNKYDYYGMFWSR